MNIIERPSQEHSGQTDRIAASLRAHAELSRRLVHEIETDSLSSQALRHRVAEIANHARQLRELL